MSVVPVIAVFTKFDMLVGECWDEVDESLRYSEEGEHIAQQQAQEIFEKEFLNRIETKKPKTFVCLSGKFLFVFAQETISNT